MRVDEVEGIAVAEAQTQTQQQLTVEQQNKATVLGDLSERLAELKRSDLHVGVEQDQRASEVVSADAADRVKLVEDLTKLCTRVDGISEAARECIENLAESDRFFSENALQEMSKRLPLEMQDRETERQQMDNQERVFAEQAMVETFALNQETTVDEVAAQREAWQQQYDQVSARLQQDPPLSERFDLEQQAVDLCNDIDYYETLERVAARTAYEQQCTETQAELQKQDLRGPVLLDEQGLPVQQFGSQTIGPAHATEEKAQEAAQAEYERRVAAGREDAAYPHVAQVEIRDRNEQVVRRWWETSELDQQYCEGHTEQKAINRIDFEAMKEREYQLYIAGVLTPCPWKDGCQNAMEIIHREYDVDIEYQAGNRHYRYND